MRLWLTLVDIDVIMIFHIIMDVFPEAERLAGVSQGDQNGQFEGKKQENTRSSVRTCHDSLNVLSFKTDLPSWTRLHFVTRESRSLTRRGCIWRVVMSIRMMMLVNQGRLTMMFTESSFSIKTSMRRWQAIWVTVVLVLIPVTQSVCVFASFEDKAERKRALFLIANHYKFNEEKTIRRWSHDHLNDDWLGYCFSFYPEIEEDDENALQKKENLLSNFLYICSFILICFNRSWDTGHQRVSLCSRAQELCSRVHFKERR